MSKSKKKASDIFNASEPFLGRKISFNEAFPQIEKINVDIDEYKDFWEKRDVFYPVIHHHNESDFRQYVNCSEDYCYGGGFSVWKIVSEMVTNKQTYLEDSSGCIGKIGNSKGRRCMHKFNYKINIIYKKNP